MGRIVAVVEAMDRAMDSSLSPDPGPTLRQRASSAMSALLGAIPSSPWSPAFLLGAATLLGGGPGAALHDPLAGLLPSAPLAAAVLWAEPEEGARLAQAAGAAAVLRTGETGVELELDSSSRVRRANGRPIALPESLDQTMQITAAELGPSPDSQLFSGRVVVVAPPLDGASSWLLAPGSEKPVHRALVEAIALAEQRSAGGLWQMPLPAATLLVVGMSLGFSAWFARRHLRSSLVELALSTSLLLAGWLGARHLGADLPLASFVLAPAGALLARTFALALCAIQAVDRVALRLSGALDGDPWVQDVVDACALVAPGHSVALWLPEEGRLQAVTMVERGPAMPQLVDIPSWPQRRSGHLIVPLYEGGRPVAAVTISGPNPHAAGELLSRIATLRGTAAVEGDHSSDPHQRTIQSLPRLAMSAVWRARLWAEVRRNLPDLEVEPTPPPARRSATVAMRHR
jgi:hypothetical protein